MRISLSLSSGAWARCHGSVTKMMSDHKHDRTKSDHIIVQVAPVQVQARVRTRHVLSSIIQCSVTAQGWEDAKWKYSRSGKTHHVIRGMDNKTWVAKVSRSMGLNHGIGTEEVIVARNLVADYPLAIPTRPARNADAIIESSPWNARCLPSRFWLEEC